jgi:predicted RNA-binding Zn ribbon-like protein
MKKIRSVEALPIDSSRLCCNFVNTVYSWKGDDGYDFLEDYAAFNKWCVRLAVLESGSLDKLRLLADKMPAKAARVMTEVRKLRHLIHAFLSSIAQKNNEQTNLYLEKINPLLSGAHSKIYLNHTGETYLLCYKNADTDLLTPARAVMKSLYDLLTSDDMDRLKECPGCGWIFYDETKNGRRRWCNPVNCGTKDKMSRYYKKLTGQN